MMLMPHFADDPKVVNMILFGYVVHQKQMEKDEFKTFMMTGYVILHQNQGDFLHQNQIQQLLEIE